MTQPPPGFPFYPLANPKGTEFKCEVCGKPAFIQCAICRVTYYCGTEHQKIDWVGIHEKICSSLMVIRKPVPFIASEDERRSLRDELQDKNIDMVALTQLVGQKLLFQGKPEEAVPAALQCLKFTADAYGLASVELVSPYLILAESSIGLGRLCQAEAYLAQAQWTMLKTQHECSNAIRSQLHRKLGLLYAAKGDYEAALESLAKDIFYASCEYGTDHIRTAGGYFQMAEVFYAIHQRDQQRCKEALADPKASQGPYSLIGPSATPQISGGPKPMPDNPILGGVHCCVPNPPCNTLSLGSDQPISPPKDKLPVADSLYARVVDIWCDHLAGIVRSLTYRPLVPEGIGAVVAEITQEKLETLVRVNIQHRLQWLGHVLRMPEHRLPRRVLFSVPRSGWRKPRGGQQMTWQKGVKEITKSLGVAGAVCLRGWGSRDPVCAWLETLQEMVANQC
ncbi:hypothetical protein T265_09214 [Opisthorchis viverrini]|uniref:MYND-type domain-containing protein n=1 Tax=Opisthorchis viverrini TaxID=6198 RepID=A0A074Z6H3_OPIVI|nr:hypothetical protein T265_09214 [Opisthorchis viverrini]KER22771.1 hypothetical protein T265_09214 [Opisthorchis viverrini]